MGIRRAHVYSGGEPAPDLAAYVAYLEHAMRVDVTGLVLTESHAHG
jgi:hypothetical protein